MSALLLIGLVLLGCFLVVGIAAWRAPDGWEDDRGFHYGREPDGDDWQWPR